MRNLKDYLKLIFTAVVCFVMNFVPGKKSGREVLTESDVTKRNKRQAFVLSGACLNKAVSNLNGYFTKRIFSTGSRLLGVVNNNSVWNKNRKETYEYKIQRSMSFIKRNISSLAFYNTG